jgi:hypothetical protein
LIAVLALGLLGIGCASSGSGGDVPAAPAPEPPPEPPPPPPFDAAEFHSEEYGFRVLYPKDFQQEPGDGTLFTAASPMMAPRLDVSRSDAGPEMTLDMAAAAAETQFKTLGGGEAKLVEKKMTKLHDGSEVMEFLIEWTFQGFPLKSVALFAPRAEDLISVVVTGMDGMSEVSDLVDIAHTLSFD